MGSHIDKYLLPKFGELSIDAVDERRVQEFIAGLNHTEPAPKSIRNIIGVLKQILGKSRWRDWSLVLPEVAEREQRYFTEDEMRKIILSVEWIGHSSLRTTSRYTHIRPEFRERVAAEVGLFKADVGPNGPNLQ